ncbi:MAG: N-acetylmuramoyl-L-alanine amidase CwlD [Sarcina sp.]
MNKKRCLSFMAIFFVFLSVLLNIKVSAKNNNESKRIILIDPGHGGIDGGAKAKDETLEKDINLSIALKLKDSLETNGYKVCITRDTDIGLYEKGNTIREKKREDLSNRSKMKEKTNCDIFISIHQNMFPQNKCKGAQVWYASNDNSKKLAELLQEGFKLDIDSNNNRLAKAAGEQYRILRDNHKGASVIVECGFLSNNEELAMLKNEEYQKKIAQSITQSILKYFS